MRQLTRDLLKAALKKMAASRGEEVLPLNIAVIRSSGSDGHFKTMISKEVAGFKQALADFVKAERKLIGQVSGSGSSKWYPGVIWSVLQDNVPDACGVMGRDYSGQPKLKDSAKALLVADTITCSNYFDVFLSLPTKQERQLYGRVVRLVTLMDDYNEDAKGRPKLKLSRSAPHFSDYICLVYSSIWSYALNIPFPKVPNYPAPIKFAEHYASWQYGILTDEDMNLQSLAIDVDNAKPKICSGVSPSPPPTVKKEARGGGGDVEMRTR